MAFSSSDSAFRITPACAGKSAPLTASTFWLWDHPRVCGEKKNSIYAMGLNTGSPPRVRGKGSSRGTCSPLDRITPACAGKREGVTDMALHKRDHPRVCGEKKRINLNLTKKEGSPPRVRGKAPCIREDLERMGITPACAGKSRATPEQSVSHRDHPRVCGEKLYAMLAFVLIWGSPPRVRGKGTRICQDLERVGITPACAGKRKRGIALLLAAVDHPRVCGEKTKKIP